MRKSGLGSLEFTIDQIGAEQRDGTHGRGLALINSSA